MTREDAIETIKIASAFNSENSPLTEAIQMAIADMEKQIPKFVKSKEYKGVRDTRYKCPVCKKFVRVNTKHCDECGQALKFPKLKRIDNRFEFDWTEEGE